MSNLIDYCYKSNITRNFIEPIEYQSADSNLFQVHWYMKIISYQNLLRFIVWSKFYRKINAANDPLTI